MFIINLLTGILDCNVTILIIGGWCYFLDDITIILHRTSEYTVPCFRNRISLSLIRNTVYKITCYQILNLLFRFG